MLPSLKSLLLIQAVWVCLGQDLESMDTMQLLSHYGAPGEQHRVLTEDGYELTIHRLIQKGTATKRPVLLQHGMMGVSDCWVLMGCDKDLAFLLWENGFDVWLGNVRGTTYGKKNVKKTVQDPSFWEYSFHEMGYYDMPAVIDYVLKLTGYPDLYYVGHSMGNTMFFIMCSTKPEYNKKIRTMFAFAPVVFFKYTAHWQKQLANFDHPIYNVSKFLGIYEVPPVIKLVRKLLAEICSDDSPEEFCNDLVLSYFNVRNNDNLNKTLLSKLFYHLATTSFKTLTHYLQLIGSGKFTNFDYGFIQNVKLYGSRTPPNYDLSLVTAPVVLCYSKNDPLSIEKDVEYLATLLPNVIDKLLLQDYGHLDYLLSVDVKQLLYDRVIKIIEDNL